LEDRKNCADVSLVAATADPGPLGLGAFALTTFVLSMANAGFVPPEVKPVFVTLGLFYGGLTQLLAGMQEFKKNNTFGATAFSSFGAFWLALASLVLFELVGFIKFGDYGNIATGLFLIAYTIFTFYMWIGSFKVNGAVCAVFTTLVITFVLLDLAEFGFISAKPGGIVGLICAACAWYASAAGVINSTYGKVVLPVWPAKKGGAAGKHFAA
jgi:succinate-acetate transporter protein